jgi:cell division topological specificity factor
MSFFKRLFGREDSQSGDVARNRLQVILVHDRVDLSPGKMDQLKRDIAAVISRYVEVDQEGIDIALTDSNRRSRLTAHIPVTGQARSK